MNTRQPTDRLPPSTLRCCPQWCVSQHAASSPFEARYVTLVWIGEDKRRWCIWAAVPFVLKLVMISESGHRRAPVSCAHAFVGELCACWSSWKVFRDMAYLVCMSKRNEVVLKMPGKVCGHFSKTADWTAPMHSGACCHVNFDCHTTIHGSDNFLFDFCTLQIQKSG